MINKHQLFYKISFVIIGLFIALVSFWLLFPYKGLEIKNNPVPVSVKSVEAGGSIYYELDFCRYTNKPAIITRQFIDGVVYTTQPINVIDKYGCGKRKTLVMVPNTLFPDTYHLNVIVKIEVNPIRTMTYTFQTEDFVVTNKNIEK